MNRIQLHLLAFVFAAFLPPKTRIDDDNSGTVDYYSILGVQKSCKQEEIRKAYKKKSLQYHPDKVAQFARSNNKSSSEIQADFVKIKEAYEILSDVDKRNAFDVLGPAGGKMFNDYNDPEASFDPSLLITNLQTASYTDKTKLFFLVFLFIAVILLGPVLICIKVDSIFNGKNGSFSDTEWYLILIPVWIFSGLFLVVTGISQAWFPMLRTTCIIILEVFLALKWDGTISWDYVYVLIPLILHQFIVLAQSFVTIQNVLRDVKRMVTLSYLEKQVLPTFSLGDLDNDEELELPTGSAERRYYDDLTEEEKEAISKIYIIVNGIEEESIDGNSDDDNSQIDPEIKVLFDIANSYEFQIAAQRKTNAQSNIIRILVTRVPFLVLLILKLDFDKDWDWNVVFCPIWIEICASIVANCFICCCSSTSNGEIVYEDLRNEENADADVETGDTTETKQGRPNGGLASETNEAIIGKINEKKDSTEAIGEESDTTELEQEKLDGGFSTETNEAIIGNSDNENKNQREDINVNPDEDEAKQDESEDEEYIPKAYDDQIRRGQSCNIACCNLLAIIFLALFLVKLNGYENENEDSNKGNYSSFWVIFPLFFTAGLVLCCCACCIYSKVDMEKVESMMERRGQPERRGDANDNPDAGTTGLGTSTNATPGRDDKNSVSSDSDSYDLD